jgi:hypothetical protein
MVRLKEKMDKLSGLSNLVQSMKFSISKNLIEGTPVEDFNSIESLCEMRVFPTGKEDPKAIVRRMTNRSLSGLVSQYKQNSGNPIFAPVYSFFFMEWCYRQDYLKNDWSWEWNTEKEGEIRYLSELSIDQLVSKMENTCLRLFSFGSTMEVKCSKCGLLAEPGSGLTCRSCRASTIHPFRVRVPSFSELDDRKSFPAERKQTLLVVAVICFFLPIIMSLVFWTAQRFFGLSVILRAGRTSV